MNALHRTLSNVTCENLKIAGGIVDHEFPDDIIADGTRLVDAMYARIEAGQSTWEQEEARLLDQWNALRR